MGWLDDLVAFGDAPECASTSVSLRKLCVLRSATRWMLAVALLGFAFSGVLTYRAYTSPAVTAGAPRGLGGSSPGVPTCVYGLALCSVLVGLGALALVRTRGGVGDEIMDTTP
jgi:hypothetical protein